MALSVTAVHLPRAMPDETFTGQLGAAFTGAEVGTEAQHPANPNTAGRPSGSTSDQDGIRQTPFLLQNCRCFQSSSL